MAEALHENGFEKRREKWVYIRGEKSERFVHKSSPGWGSVFLNFTLFFPPRRLAHGGLRTLWILRSRHNIYTQV